MFVFRKVLGIAFTEEGRKYKGNMGVGFDISTKTV
jgi:hypothetical protein